MKEKRKRPYHPRPIFVHRRVKNGASIIGNGSSTSDNNFFFFNKNLSRGLCNETIRLLLAFWRHVPRVKIMTRYNKSKHILDLETANANNV